MSICQCGNEKKLVPAGVSKKTGRPYNAFEICETCKPSSGRPAQPQPQYNKPAPKNGDEIIRIALVKSFTEAKKPLDRAELQEAYLMVKNGFISTPPEPTYQPPVAPTTPQNAPQEALPPVQAYNDEVPF